MAKLVVAAPLLAVGRVAGGRLGDVEWVGPVEPAVLEHADVGVVDRRWSNLTVTVLAPAAAAAMFFA